ncbi:uncharacterized protein LTR77_008162 [Saxophila tyrrhenica]|uniref:Osmotin, thaumatin-like protein n=1 Tax=Saxophila tyrrhenica TaxID=1690608 RepID=A0AAV9P5Y5_9PEZI|nr:hypothetical protein LTR77_008162 [Saxophila tyrrhenica]
MECRVLLLILTSLVLRSSGEHHMKQQVERRQSSNKDTPIVVANWCADDVYPAMLTQSGGGPTEHGLRLQSGENQTIYVSDDWQGRVWARTNCSFDDSGQAQGGSGSACSTGDCGGALGCQIAGAPPATLAEFTLHGGMDQTYYDISLVDGYNLPLAIVMLANGNSELEQMQGSKTNPSCVGSVGDLAPQNFDPYKNGQQFLGTSSNNPMPFETKTTSDDVEQWCPWDLQVDAPTAPGNGIYPYPDGNVQRPVFDPCLSACAKYSEDQYCCTGKYDGPSQCSTNYYAKAAKSVCPDAYSYAYDDQDSTFIIPEGAGFQVIFCPGRAGVDSLPDLLQAAHCQSCDSES